MTDQCALRVFFRASLGLPFRQASDEEKRKVDELWNEMATKWKSAGVRLVGYFGAHGEALDGFGHNYIFEVDDVEIVRKMDDDIVRGELGKYIERFSFHIGCGRGVEDWWRAL
jgi:hypothetical protein